MSDNEKIVRIDGRFRLQKRFLDEQCDVRFWVCATLHGNFLFGFQQFTHRLTVVAARTVGAVTSLSVMAAPAWADTTARIGAHPCFLMLHECHSPHEVLEQLQ
jgi:hypothetical protein